MTADHATTDHPVVDAVFETVAQTAPEVRESLVGRRSYEAGENPSGEQQLEADLFADQLFEEALLALEGVGSYASEERDDVVEADEQGDDDYHLALDPLDGSSNVKSNNAMGTIVAVFDEPLPAGGDALVAAGYVLYGPLTTMVVACDGQVSEYTVIDSAAQRDAGDASGDGTEPRAVERTVNDADLTLPEDPTVYGFGGRVPEWTDDFAGYVGLVEDELKLRYGGAMIGDVNQVLTYGGIFGYPGLRHRSEGKLRLLFEGIPIAAIVEAAGGRSSDGSGSLLKRTPEELHERTPVFVGNDEFVERLELALE
ncbi:class 1 fructose-bisphosphatase [Halomarina oriensis]|uniref:Fructose-1,6-bisphosphatase class 1 n=1 Tax=Halomarina oriensis TaxID=671145 RepID=A0A6B0GM84_9EURY|nr:class 1 fructose-bisphosphatase [Halomarina oriensis]MWG33245.1 class 1 fructose-bisphosphatase [Halomarina oriensis]